MVIADRYPDAVSAFRTDIDACFVTVADDTFEPTIHAQGAWALDELHVSPVCGLLVDAIERHDPRPELQLAKVTFDILGRLPVGPGVVEVRTLRPGRTIELVEATFAMAGRVAVRASAWRLLRGDSPQIAGTDFEAIAPPQDCEPVPGESLWPGGWVSSLEIRRDPHWQPGRGQVWVKTAIPLVADRPVSDLAAFCALVDTANGVVVRESPTEWMFPNTELSVHLFRRPVAGWVGFDTTVSFGEEGIGLTSTTLHDTHGPLGRAEQILTVRPIG